MVHPCCLVLTMLLVLVVLWVMLPQVGRLLGPRVLDLPGWEAAAKEVVAELKDLETHPVGSQPPFLPPACA